MKTQLEIIRVTTKGITVNVRLDYKKMHTTLVEYIDGEWKPQKWVFADRGAEYMQSWRDIFWAMDCAAEEAERKLKKRKEEKEEEAMEAVIELDKAMKEADDKRD